MKNIYLPVLLLAGFIFAQAQTLNIPDPNFKAKLLVANCASFDATGTNRTNDVDTNNDGEIQLSEAQAVTGLFLPHNNNSTGGEITSMEGLEYFTNLKSLYCRGNQITTLDVSMLNVLTKLGCANNFITEISLPQSGSLKEFAAYDNQLNQVNFSGQSQLYYIELSSNNFTSLNLSVLPALTTAFIGDNPITQIDLSSNILLTRLHINNTLITTIDCSTTQINNLWCRDNPNLVSINVKNNVVSWGDPTMLDFAFMLDNTPALQTICVDNGEQYKLLESDYNPNGTVTVYTGANCDLAIPMGLKDKSMLSVKIYPNPASSYITVDAGTQTIESFVIYNTLGQIVKTQSFKSSNIDISELSNGTYLLKIEDEYGSSTHKIVKQ